MKRGFFAIAASGQDDFLVGIAVGFDPDFGPGNYIDIEAFQRHRIAIAELDVDAGERRLVQIHGQHPVIGRAGSGQRRRPELVFVKRIHHAFDRLIGGVSDAVQGERSCARLAARGIEADVGIVGLVGYAEQTVIGGKVGAEQGFCQTRAGRIFEGPVTAQRSGTGVVGRGGDAGMHQAGNRLHQSLTIGLLSHVATVDLKLTAGLQAGADTAKVCRILADVGIGQP